MIRKYPALRVRGSQLESDFRLNVFVLRSRCEPREARLAASGLAASGLARGLNQTLNCNTRLLTNREGGAW